MAEVHNFDTSEYPNLTQVAKAPPTTHVRVDVAAASHTGHVRETNEDHYLIARISRSLETVLTNLATADLPGSRESHGYIFAIADGLGGHSAGEMASRLAIHSGLELVLGATNWALQISPEESSRLLSRMRDYVLRIDQSFQREMAARPDLVGMATTLSVAYTVGYHAFLVHVGDTRVYSFRDGHLSQLTRDHTVAQSFVDSGLITSEEVRTHAKRHVLTNVISGHPGDVRPDVAVHTLQPGDTLLLSSDGLHDLVEDNEIAAILNGHTAPQAACDALIAIALSRGGRDNVTTIVAKYTDAPIAR